MTVQTKRRRFTLDQYHRMGHTRVLGVDDRVELVGGEVVELSAITTRHASAVARIAHLFATRLDRRALVWTQNPLSLAQQQSEPLPDLMLLVPRADFYVGGLPEPPSVRLLIGLRIPVHMRSCCSSKWPTPRSTTTVRRSCRSTRGPA